jgi:hypothetical protein
MSDFQIPLSELQPSQLMVSAAKLERVLAFPTEIESLPVKRLAGRLVLTDGHTRALVALQKGRETITVHWDEDDNDWKLYEVCVGWCLEEGVRHISDLTERVVPHEQHQRLWIDRCERLGAQLDAERAAGKPIDP